MKAAARAYGAVTIVNAIPAWKGAALGVRLKTEARVELTSGSFSAKLLSTPGESTRLVIEAAKLTLRRLGEHDAGAHIETWSEIPPARGLKSSSAAANAVIMATAAALGRKLRPHDVLSLSAEAQLRAEVSVTGALDDSAASLLGGLVAADNKAGEVVSRWHVEERSVVILVPERKLYTASVSVEKMRALSKVFRKAYELTLSGEWQEAALINGLAVSALLGIDFKPALKAMELGALAAGVSGTGPSLYAVCSSSVAEEVREKWASSGCRVLLTRVNSSLRGEAWTL